MALNWTIAQDAHGLFVTCQRPIVIRVKVLGTQPAHLVATLLIETSYNSGTFVDTGVRINGYRENDSNSNYYSFNVAEYCQNFFDEEEAFYGQQWCGNFHDMLQRSFKLLINPMLFNNNGGLDLDADDTLESKAFIVTATNTMVEESTSTAEDYIRMDKFVNNGSNNSGLAWNSSSWNRLMTNMPRNNVMDMSKGFYYFFPIIVRPVAGRTTFLHIQNAAGVTEEIGVNIPTGEHMSIHIHPVILEFWLLLIGSANQGMLVDPTTGELTTDSLLVTLKHRDTATGSLIRSSPSMRYKLVNGCDGCQCETFLFKNMRGNFDFFCAKGTQAKEVQLGGVDFDRHTDFRREISNFDVLRGQHSTTNLYNSRKQLFTTFSQPLTTEQANWLEELIVSPMVWVIREIKDYASGNKDFYGHVGLVAVNIIKGSFKLHTTERNVHFIEFKYTLSENTLVQKN